MAPVMFEQIDAEITDEQPKPGGGAAGRRRQIRPQSLTRFGASSP